jgi:enoyl-CoA hydratase/carnithine racemase
MTADPRILVEVRDHVARITLNSPNNLNAVDAAMLHALADAVDEVGAKDDVRVIVLAGAGRGFCSGANLLDPSVTVDEDTLYAAGRVVRRLTEVGQPVITKVGGVAAGVGLSIALAGDYTLVAESAPLTLAFSKIALMPDGGATQLVAASIGRVRALRLALTGERISARDAERTGLIAEAVPDDRLDTRTDELVEQLVCLGARAAALTKRAINEATLDLDGTLAREEAGQVELLRATEFAEGVAAFREKRPPRFHRALETKES